MPVTRLKTRAALHQDFESQLRQPPDAVRGCGDAPLIALDFAGNTDFHGSCLIPLRGARTLQQLGPDSRAKFRVSEAKPKGSPASSVAP